MKKYILLFGIMIMFLLPMAFALEFDNRVRDYDERTRTVIIDDNFGLGGDLVSITLMSNTDVCLTECEAIWNVTILADDDNFLGDLLFEDLGRSSVLIDHEFHLLAGYNSMTVIDYEEDCSRKDALGICSLKKVGTHQERVENWISFDPARKLPVGNYIIKLKGKKDWTQTVDWIPTFYGKQIRQWAFWSPVNPTTVWEFNNGAGGLQANDTLSIRNLSTNLTNGDFETGKLNNSWRITATDNGVTLNATGASQFAFGLDNFTVAFWVNTSISSSSFVLVQTAESGAGWGLNIDDSFTNITFVSGGAVRARTQAEIRNSEWVRIVFVREGTGAGEFKLYENGTNYANFTNSDDMTDASTSIIFRSPNAAGDLWWDSFQIYNGYAWTVDDVAEDYNNGEGIEAGNELPASSFEIGLNSPANDTTFTVSDITFNASVTSIENLNLTNATILIYSSATTLFNQSNISVTGDSVINESIFDIGNFVVGTYFWNIQMCGINDNETASVVCTQGASNRTLTVEHGEIETSFNDFTYETAQETFQSNVSLVGGATITSVNLIYNGTTQSATSSLISGANFTLQATIDIPTSAISTANNTQWFFSVNLDTGQQNFTARNQSVGAINLSIFGVVSAALPYMNFTFSNETVAQEAVSATASTTWIYYLGSGTVNKTLNFVDASENFNYSFSFAPQNRTIQADLVFDYNNGESQQRRFEPSILTLTNTTLLQTLFLLPTSDGVFQQFVTQDIIGSTVKQVIFVINRTIGGSNVEISSGITDDSGFASVFLNPDFSYDARFTKVGFIANAFSFSPSSQLRTVVMGTSTAASNGTTISRNTNITITPSAGSLVNNTATLFSFNVSSIQAITLITMNITNLSGFQVGFQSNAGVGFISQTINTGENRTFIGEFTYSTGTGNETITFNRRWEIYSIYVGDYSIFRQLSLYMSYGFGDFIRILIVLSFIIAILIFMSTGEVIDSSESKVMVAVLLIWVFSVVGWLDTGLAVSGGNLAGLSEFSNQYGIAILTTGGGVYFLFRKLLT